ncbi:negative elongation factor A-like isoform X2 [Penaeus vannamei]|uniref:negative elongation factor A-like isoform X2 n=1 Tax=Penaeus vannamei TaxID=6689 RepID=UPI00387F5388
MAWEEAEVTAADRLGQDLLLPVHGLGGTRPHYLPLAQKQLLWRTELEEILEVAVVDSEAWVAMLAEIMRTCPSTGHLNLDIREPPENQRITHDLITELRKLVKKYSELGLLPMECNYLNRNAFLAAAGSQAPHTKHFALKRKPKAAALRADLISRSSDAQANVKKSQLPTVPVRSRGMPRKMTDTTPLKGIPSRLPGSGLRGSGLGSTPVSRPLVRPSVTRKDGGIKLLDITESPIAAQQAKKRRKLQDTADAKAAEAEEKRREQQQQGDGKQAAQQQQQQQQQQQPTTPEYAAGLAPANPETPSPATPSTPLLSASAGGASTLHTNAVAVGTIAARSTLQQTSTSTGRATPTLPATPSGGTTPQRIIVTPSTQAAGSPTVVYRTVSHTPVYTTTEVIQASTDSVSPTTREGTPNGQPQYATLQPVQPDLVYTTTPLTTAALAAAATPTTQQQQQPAQQQQQQQQPQQQQAPQQQQQQAPQVITVAAAAATQQENAQPQQVPINQTAVTTQQQQQKRGLSLTREQMLEAQEMFRSSNKVTRPEKALILGFMAGSRENPCPHLGNIVTIKLSEGEETVPQPEGTFINMMAETHFQMNYNTGEWKRIKKYRPLPVE